MDGDIPLVPVNYDPFDPSDYASHLLRMAHIDDQTQAQEAERQPLPRDPGNMPGMGGMDQSQLNSIMGMIGRRPDTQPTWSNIPISETSPGQEPPTFQDSFDAARRAQQRYDAGLGRLPALGDFGELDHRGYYDDSSTYRDLERRRMEGRRDYRGLKDLEKRMEEEQRIEDENTDENSPPLRYYSMGA